MAGRPPLPPRPALPSLRVASYNIHKGVLGLGMAKRLSIHDLQSGLQELAPDLVFLQEVQGLHHQHATRFRHWPQQGQHDFLGQSLGLQAVYRTNAYTRFGEHGNALLTRFDVVNVHHHDISDHRLEQRGFLHVVMNAAGRPLHALVIHLGLFHGSRLRQAQALVHYIHHSVPRDEALVMAGDFNDWRNMLGPDFRRAGLVDASPVLLPTFPALRPVLALDRIYLRGVEVAGAFVPKGRPWARRSDHLPLVADLHWHSDVEAT